MNAFISGICFIAGLAIWTFEFWWASKVQAWGISEITSLTLLTCAILALFLVPYWRDFMLKKRLRDLIAHLEREEHKVEYIPPPRKQGDNTPTWQKKN